MRTCIIKDFIEIKYVTRLYERELLKEKSNIINLCSHNCP